MLLKIYQNKSKNNVEIEFDFLVRTITEILYVSLLFSIEHYGEKRPFMRKNNFEKVLQKIFIQIEI